MRSSRSTGRHGENIAHGRRDVLDKFRLGGAFRWLIREDARRSHGPGRFRFPEWAFGGCRTQHKTESRRRLRNFVGIGGGAGNLDRSIDAVDVFAYEAAATLVVFRCAYPS